MRLCCFSLGSDIRKAGKVDARLPVFRASRYQRYWTTAVISILKTLEYLDAMGFSLDYVIKDETRVGDHVCYISDLSKLKAHYPRWTLRHDPPSIIEELVSQYRPFVRSEKGGLK